MLLTKLALSLALLCGVGPVAPVAIRDGNTKFKLCCAKQTQADKSCKQRFCDFNALAQDNVSGGPGHSPGGALGSPGG